MYHDGIRPTIRYWKRGSEEYEDTDENVYSELSQEVEQKIADDQHVESGIVTKCQIMSHGNIVADAHDDHGYEDQGKRAARSEEYGQKDQDVREAHVDRGDGDSVQSPKERQFPVYKTRGPGEAQSQYQDADPEDGAHDEEGHDRMVGEKIGLSEDKRDQHAEERRIRKGCKDDHQRSQRREKAVDKKHFRDGYDLGSVLDRRDRMPDIGHDRTHQF